MTTNELSSRLKETQEKAHQELAALGTLEALEAWRVAYLGRHGALTALLRSLSGLPPEARRDAGALGNQAKAALEAAFALREAELKASALAHAEARGKLDVTLPGTPFTLGRLHPTTQILREICGAFSTMGFQVVEGPEVEWDEYNFEKLNIPRDHPARDMWNTLWVDYQDPEGQPPARTGGQPPAQTGGQRQMLLRTHTSPMQARVMEKTRPPIRVVVPGRCYRYEATDATHEWQFTQVEGLAVDDGITFADMKGTLYEFARRIFGPERKVRFRCDYFPFVEPGAEMAIDCFACQGKGCRLCKESGWIEILGAGMVHPRVLEGVGYDSSKYTGFAFGLGAERIAMLKYGIEDVRLFYANDLRFLRQF